MTLTDPEVEVDNVFYTLSDDVYNKVALSFEKCFTLIDLDLLRLSCILMSSTISVIQALLLQV